VKVLAKPIGGPYEGWTFEAITSQQADDDLAWTYCGLLYLYDHINVYLASPNKNNGQDGGRAFCIGMTNNLFVQWPVLLVRWASVNSSSWQEACSLSFLTF